MVPVNPGLFLKITRTGMIIITKKGPGIAGTGIPVGHYGFGRQASAEAWASAKFWLRYISKDYLKPAFYYGSKTLLKSRADVSCLSHN